MAKAFLLHISDIHIQFKEDGIFQRLEKLVRAVRSLDSDVNTCFLIISGDIAYSGEAEEYKLAKSLYTTLEQGLKQYFNNIETIIVPGNHDCFVKKEESVRTIILSQLYSGKGIDIDGGVISGCTTALKNFFAFAKDILGRQYPEDLFFTQNANVDGKAIAFHCYNTAWMSKKKEAQGAIVFPTGGLPPISITDALHVSVFHHPYNWLRADSAKDFRRHIESSSHLILTGHEHEFDSYTKTRNDGLNTHYFEGGVLNETKEPEVSSFNVIVLDLDAAQQRFYHLEWSESLYKASEASKWVPITINSAIEGEIFRPNEAYQDVLQDVGANFKHPRKSSALNLTDLFIWPDVRDNKMPSEDKPFSISKGENIPSYVTEHKYILLVGRDKIGKTALLKVLYQSLGKGHVALLLKGESFREPQEDKIKAMIKSEFAKQYSAQLVEKYFQLPPAEKILLLDDFHKIPINLRGKNEILRILSGLYDFIVITTDDDFNLEEVVEASPEESCLARFKSFEIMEMGYALRERLIAKWLTLGNEYSANYEDLQHEIRQAHSLISTVLGKNLIPSFPVFTLILLQQVEAGKNTPTANGSYGYMYEYLITEALGTSRFREAEIGTKYSYLSFLAYDVFQKDKQRIDQISLRAIHDAYLKKNDLQFSLEGILEDLARAGILSKKFDGYQFKYRYLYYYFIARYFSRNTDNRSLAESLKAMCSKLYNEDYANIIIFYSYLTQDKAILEAILVHARDLYREFLPCDLESPVTTLKAYQEEIEELEFNQGDAESTRATILAQKDEDTNIDEREVKGLVDINDAFKTIQIIGQILRNFPGDLGSELKRDMAKECYSLGMRLLSYIMTILFDADKVYLKHVVSVVIAEHKALAACKRKRKGSARSEMKALPEGSEDASAIPLPLSTASKSDLVGRAQEYIAQEMHKLTFGVIKRISDAVGSQYLSKTYEAILKDTQTVSFSLIDASIKLDHSRPCPTDDIVSLAKRLHKKNRFGYGILRDLTYLNMYLFYHNYKVRQQLCQGLKITLTNKRLIAGPQKKDRR